jgi:hypothetical protein
MYRSVPCKIGNIVTGTTTMQGVMFTLSAALAAYVPPVPPVPPVPYAANLAAYAPKLYVDALECYNGTPI